MQGGKLIVLDPLRNGTLQDETSIANLYPFGFPIAYPNCFGAFCNFACSNQDQPATTAISSNPRVNRLATEKLIPALPLIPDRGCVVRLLQKSLFRAVVQSKFVQRYDTVDARYIAWGTRCEAWTMAPVGSTSDS